MLQEYVRRLQSTASAHRVPIGILAVALALRFAYLGQEPIVFDANRSLYYSTIPAMEFLRGYPEIDPHPPLFYWLTRAWRWVGGSSDLWVRLPVATLGAVAAPTLYAIGKRLFDRPTGIWAGLLIATVPQLVWRAQQLRMYAVLLCFGTLSLYLFIRLRDSFDRRVAAAYILVTAAAFYTHVLGALIPATQGVLILGSWASQRELPRDELRTWASAFGGVGVLLLPWMPTLLEQILSPGYGFEHNPDPSVSMFIAMWAHFVRVDTGVTGTIAGVLAVVFLLGLAARHDQWPSRSLATALGWAAIPIVALVAVTLIGSTNLFGSRFFFNISGPGVLLLVAAGIESLANASPQQGTSRRASRVLAAALVVSLGATSGTVVAADSKPDWHHTVDYLDANAGADDVVITDRPQPMNELEWYADDPTYRIAKPSRAVTEGEVLQAASNATTVWVVATTDRGHIAASHLRNHEAYTLVDRQRGGPAIYRFVSASQSDQNLELQNMKADPPDDPTPVVSIVRQNDSAFVVRLGDIGWQEGSGVVTDYRIQVDGERIENRRLQEWPPAEANGWQVIDGRVGKFGADSFVVFGLSRIEITITSRDGFAQHVTVYYTDRTTEQSEKLCDEATSCEFTPGGD